MSKPIRILHCLPGDMNQGGIENLIMNIYRKIDREKVQFDFIIHSKEKSYYEEEIKELGGNIYRVAFKSKNPIKYKKDMEQILNKKSEYKIIHIHSTYAISLLDVILAKKFGLKVIVHAHSSNDIFKRTIVNLLLKRKMTKITDYKIACSNKAASWLFTKRSIHNNEILFLKNAIDIKKFIYNETVRREQRDILNIQDKFVVGLVSRLSFIKNVDFLVDIFKYIHEKEKNSVLLLVGDGPERKKIEEKVNRLELKDSVIFLGKREDVFNLIQAFDAFVMPSRCEGFGISLLEAQTAGVKCFTSKDVVPKEIQIDKELLKFISLKEPPEKWGEEILKCNNEYKRLDMYYRIKSCGYDLETNITQIENMYLKIWGDI